MGGQSTDTEARWVLGRVTVSYCVKFLFFSGLGFFILELTSLDIDFNFSEEPLLPDSLCLPVSLSIDSQGFEFLVRPNLSHYY